MYVSDHFFEFASLFAYLILLLWIGLRSAKQVRTSVDYTLAGRDVSWIVILATTAATMVGGGAALGMVAQVYQIGIAAALITCAWHLQLIFTGLFVAPKLRGLNLITVGDFFALRFGELARVLAIGNCVIFLVGALAAQMAAIGFITETVLGIPYEIALLIGAVVTIYYSTVGGMQAVVKTDVIQFAILVSGIGITSAILLSIHGGFSGIAEKIGTEHFEVTSHWSALKVTSIFVAFLLGETFVPTYTVRCFIAKNSRQARWGVAGGGIFLLLFLPIATLAMGTAAQSDDEIRQLVKNETQKALESNKSLDRESAERLAAQKAFPALVRKSLPPVISGIMIAAIIAAVMSSADSNLSCLATVAMEDVYRRFINQQATDYSLLQVAKWSTLATGTAALVCAFFVRNIADLLVFVYDFWAPAMVLPFLVGLFWYKPSRVYAVVLSMIAGMLATILWRIALYLPEEALHLGNFRELGPALLGFVVAVLAYVIALPLTSHWKLNALFQPVESELKE